MSEHIDNLPAAAFDPRLKRIIEVAGSTVSLATIGTVAALYARRKRFEDGIDLYTDRLTIAEGTANPRLTARHAAIRHLTAASLAFPDGATPRQLQHQAEVTSNGTASIALNKLVEVNILNRNREKGGAVRVSPQAGFVDAVTSHPDEVPLLLDRVRWHNPGFQLEWLLPYTTDPEVAALSPHFSDNS